MEVMMLFPEESLFEYNLLELADEMAARQVPPVNPLPCDRWIARSCLQKAVRRGQVELAQRALANLYNHDRRSTWRHIAIIALEDLGVANFELLARIMAAQRNRTWRQTAGGDWPVMAELVRQMAESTHCQAACDLLLRAINDPVLEAARANALEQDIGRLAIELWNVPAAIENRAMAALAMGGGLTDQQQHNDPCAVFDILSEASRSTHVVATCRSAWKLTRNPMAMLLPLVWEHLTPCGQHAVGDDTLPPVQMLGEVPGYALDQFTRRGNAVFRTLLGESPEVREQLETAGVRSSQRVSTVGDLIFLLEGGKVRKRLIWPLADRLRFPHRCLPAVPRLGLYLNQSLLLIEAKARQIAKARHGHISTLAA